MRPHTRFLPVLTAACLLACHKAHGKAITVGLQRAPSETIVSWTTMDYPLEYRVEVAVSLPAFTQAVALISNRFAEDDLPCRFYRVKGLPGTPRPTTQHITVDQFGYLPDAVKVAVVNNPVNGFNATNSYTPAETCAIRNAVDDAHVTNVAAAAWNGGAVHGNSGDETWWLDLSGVNDPGNYYVYDPSNNMSSFTFRIAANVYAEVLKQAVRTYYYQRCNLAKTEPCAEADWTDSTPSHSGAQQDTDCRLVTNPVPATSRDLSGGWYDAGDYNKYVNFADKAVHDLLSAYEQEPGVWSDHYHIPESGNGVPDLLDELKWELDWLLRMQEPDGSFLHKVSVTNWSSGSPPSSHSDVRRYAPATASATISGCGALAHAARVYGSLPDPAMRAYGTALGAAAIAAWNWLESHPGEIPSSYDNAGFLTGAAEDSAYQQQANRICAAAYLFALTTNNTYRTFFDSQYTNVHVMQWEYIYSSEVLFQDGLLYYAALSNATPAVTSNIRGAYEQAARKMLAQFTNRVDAYRAWIDAYYWGSNQSKADNGCMMASVLEYGLDPSNHGEYRAAAAGYLHYLHGVNPLAQVYLSNMATYGAEKSVPEFYHSWFNDGTDWDNVHDSLYGPAPGFLVGGPNTNYVPDASYGGTIEPPQNQPAQKAYRSWNTGWPENSWQITENHIPCQSAYVKLLSKFVPTAP